MSNWFRSQMEAKIQKYKGKLENLKHVDQLNLELQQELLNMKENNCNSTKVSSQLKSLEKRITRKRTEDEVSIFEN